MHKTGVEMLTLWVNRLSLRKRLLTFPAVTVASDATFSVVIMVTKCPRLSSI